MKVTNDDIVEFLAISWDAPEWEFDYPSMLLKPVLQYSPNGTHPESFIEEAAIQLSCDEELEDEEDAESDAEWCGTTIKTLKRVAKERLAGKNTWSKKIREVLWQRIRFFEVDGDLEYEILETKTA